MTHVIIFCSGFLGCPYRIGQAIIFLPCCFFLSSFFLCLISPTQWLQTGCLPYFHTWCGLSANLECRSESCCRRLAENTGRKNDAKNCRLLTIARLCRAVPSQLSLKLMLFLSLCCCLILFFFLLSLSVADEMKSLVQRNSYRP